MRGRLVPFFFFVELGFCVSLKADRIAYTYAVLLLLALTPKDSQWTSLSIL